MPSFQLADLLHGAAAVIVPAARLLQSPEEARADGPMMIAAAADDARLGAFHARARALGVASLVVWMAGGSGVAVLDDGRSLPCAGCALLFDRVFVLLAAKARSSPPRETDESPPGARGCLAHLIEHVRAADPEELAPGRALVLDGDHGTPYRQEYVAHPSCPCADAGLRRAAADRPLDLEGARRCRFAPVAMMPSRPDAGLARAFFRRSRSPWPVGHGEIGAATAQGPHASERALAEAIERFCMLHAPADVRAAPAATLAEPIVPVESLRALLFRTEERSAAGFRLDDFHEKTPHDWSWIERVRDGRRSLAPTTLIGRPGQSSPRLVDATSNGYAAHLDGEEASLRALLEVVERDAILLSWYLDLEIVRLDDIRAEDFPGAAEVHAFLVTQDIDLPVVFLLALRGDGSLRCAGAAGVAFDDAWERACRELRASTTTTLRAGEPGDDARVDDPRRVVGPEDHLRYYHDPARARAAMESTRARATGRTGSARARWPERAASMGFVVDALARSGLEPWLADRSLPAVFGRGWRVVRALVPGTVELSWGQPYRRLASPRVARHLRAGRPLSCLPHPIV